MKKISKMKKTPKMMSSDFSFLSRLKFFDQHSFPPVMISDNTRPVCLPPSYPPIQERSLKSRYGMVEVSNVGIKIIIFYPRYGVISGWGRLYSGGPRKAVLQSGVVTILEDGLCEGYYPHIFNRTNPPKDLVCGQGVEGQGRSALITDSCQVGSFYKQYKNNFNKNSILVSHNNALAC